MKKKRKEWISILVVLLAGAGCVCLAASLPSAQEQAAFRETIAGSQALQARMGQFDSEDGLTASLSQVDLEATAAAYDQQVDRYYARGSACRENYKWLNRDYLFRTCKTVLFHCFDGGVLDCDLLWATRSRDGTEARVKAAVEIWNQWVRQNEDGSYSVMNASGRDYVEVKLVKEEGLWKLQETLDLDRGEFGADRAILPADWTPKTPEEEAIWQEIQESEAVCGRTYATYQEARAAAEGIDMEKGTYLALVG